MFRAALFQAIGGFDLDAFRSRRRSMRCSIRASATFRCWMTTGSGSRIPNGVAIAACIAKATRCPACPAPLFGLSRRRLSIRRAAHQRRGRARVRRLDARRRRRSRRHSGDPDALGAPSLRVRGGDPAPGPRATSTSGVVRAARVQRRARDPLRRASDAGDERRRGERPRLVLPERRGRDDAAAPRRRSPRGLAPGELAASRRRRSPQVGADPTFSRIAVLRRTSTTAISPSPAAIYSDDGARARRRRRCAHCSHSRGSRPDLPGSPAAASGPAPLPAPRRRKGRPAARDGLRGRARR